MDTLTNFDKIYVSKERKFRQKFDLSRDMTKQTKWVCAQRRLRSACASAQSDQSLCCPHEESLGPWLSIERTAKTLIRLGGCPGWSESLLGAHSFCWIYHVAARLMIWFNDANYHNLRPISLQRRKLFLEMWSPLAYTEITVTVAFTGTEWLV